MFQFQFDFNLGPRLRPRHDASWEVVTTQSVEAARSPLDLDAGARLFMKPALIASRHLER